MIKLEGLDRRSLGCFRIALGIYMIYNTITLRLLNFHDFYSVSSGFIPKQVKNSSVFTNILKTDLEVAVLMAITLVGSVALIAGYKSRLFSLLLFGIYSFFNIHYQYLSFGWDRYLEILLLLAVLLPVESRFSIFHREAAHIGKSDQYRGRFAWLALFQIALIYGVAGIAKNGVLWSEGTAAGILLLDELLTYNSAMFLVDRPLLIKSLTYSTIAFEILIPFLLFIPLKRGMLRLLAAIMIFLFHWGIACFIDVGHFKFAGTLVAILLLPSVFWDKFPNIEKRLSSLFRFRFEDPYPIHFTVKKIIKPLSVALFAFLLYGILASNLLLMSLHPDAIGTIFRKNGIDKFARSVYFDFGIRSTVFHQNWYLYSPNPNISLGKIYFTASLSDGRIIDLETRQVFEPDMKEYRIHRKFADMHKFLHTKMRNYVNKNTSLDRVIDYTYHQAGLWHKDGGIPIDSIVVYNYYLNARNTMKENSQKYELKIAIEISPNY